MCIYEPLEDDVRKTKRSWVHPLYTNPPHPHLQPYKHIARCYRNSVVITHVTHFYMKPHVTHAQSTQFKIRDSQLTTLRSSGLTIKRRCSYDDTHVWKIWIWFETALNLRLEHQWTQFTILIVKVIYTGRFGIPLS